MLLKELMEKYGNYEINEEKLMEFIQEPKQKSVWQIEEGDVYYYFDSEGAICCGVWGNYSADKERLSNGNVFFKDIEAHVRRGQLKIESLLLQYGGTRKFIEDGFIASIQTTAHDFRVIAYCVCDLQFQGAIYFETKEQCQNAIEKIGQDRIKKELFQVEQQ